MVGAPISVAQMRLSASPLATITLRSCGDTPANAFQLKFDSARIGMYG